MTDEQLKLAPCPVCNVAQAMSFKLQPGLWATCCENDDCHFTVQSLGASKEESERQWNTRAATRPAPTKAGALTTLIESAMEDWENDLEAPDTVSCAQHIAITVSAAFDVPDIAVEARESEVYLIDEMIQWLTLKKLFIHRRKPIGSYAEDYTFAENDEVTALPSEAIGREWQNISTAPKDRFIFVYCPEDQSRWLAKWQGGEWYGSDCEHGILRTGHSLGDPDFVTGWFVTHWMPLPAGPSVTRPQSGAAT